MFDRLEEIRNRYRELNEEILQPETACDYNRYQSCMKEISAIRPVVEEYEAYIGIIRHIRDAEGLRDVWDLFHEFMNERVYRNPVAKGEEAKVDNILRGIWDHYYAHPEAMPEDYRAIAERDGLDRAVTDYVSGMTDDYAIEQYGKIYIPMAWSVK